MAGHYLSKFRHATSSCSPRWNHTAPRDAGRRASGDRGGAPPGDGRVHWLAYAYLGPVHLCAGRIAAGTVHGVTVLEAARMRLLCVDMERAPFAQDLAVVEVSPLLRESIEAL